MQIITKENLKKILDYREVFQETKKAFVSYSLKQSITPLPLSFGLPNNNGEICIKTAIVPSLPTYTIKQVSVFKSNEKLGLPNLRSAMNVYDSKTGKLLAVIAEDGWLTGVRTACAVALSDNLFSKKNKRTLGIVGTGRQAEFQVEVIFSLSSCYRNVYLWDIVNEKAQIFAKNAKKKWSRINFIPVEDIGAAVSLSDTIITATPSKEPVISFNMLKRGLTIIAMGADMPNKCELTPLVYQKANKIFVDSLESNKKLGGISRALQLKTITQKDISGEIGQVIREQVSARETDDEIIIVKLVGVGTQDTFIGNYVYQKYNKNRSCYI